MICTQRKSILPKELQKFKFLIIYKVIKCLLTNILSYSNSTAHNPANNGSKEAIISLDNTKVECAKPTS